MTKMANDLLRSKHIGAKLFRSRLFHYLKADDSLVITERGEPVRVMINYDKMLDLIDMMDELSDPVTIKAVYDGRRSIARGSRGIAVSRLFSKIRKTLKNNV